MCEANCILPNYELRLTLWEKQLKINVAWESHSLSLLETAGFCIVVPLPFLDVSRRDWIISLWRITFPCEIRVTLVGVFSIAYLVQARSSGMQFVNVTLFKQSPLSNTAKHIASNQSGEKTRSAGQRTKKFKPYVRLSSESNMQDIR